MACVSAGVGERPPGTGWQARFDDGTLDGVGAADVAALEARAVGVVAAVRAALGGRPRQPRGSGAGPVDDEADAAPGQRAPSQ